MTSAGAIRPTRVEIDLGAVAENARAIAGIAGSACRLFAVVKADAYGHGAAPVARALADSAVVHGFAVSLVEEGEELRDAGVTLPILVMGPSMAGGERLALDADLWPMVSSLAALRAIAEASAGRVAPAVIHLKLDTGMGRLGLTRAELAEALRMIRSEPGLRLGGIATHLACADDDDPHDESCRTHRQLACFRRWLEGPEVPGSILRHAANSAGVLRFPGSRLDAVRAGLALYAAGPACDRPEFRPTTRLVSAITQIRRAEAGDSVGYGALWTAERPSTLAVVPAGYADGLPRSLTGRAEALVRGRRVPLVGAVSMDITVLDVTDFPDIAIGEEVVFLGVQGDDEISIPEFAHRAGLTHYEVTCGISKRVPRVYR